ncbi:MAG TPA: hypothetical protein VM327_08130 [Candidatus Thermoplasmatota archaeon]|nr:hypothetical protein [Candidatus Thermoplasmatota archaeon]
MAASSKERILVAATGLLDAWGAMMGAVEASDFTSDVVETMWRLDASMKDFFDALGLPDPDRF